MSFYRFTFKVELNSQEEVHTAEIISSDHELAKDKLNKIYTSWDLSEFTTESIEEF